MVLVIILGLYLFTLIIDFIPKVKSQKIKTSIVYCMLLSISFVILLLYSVDIVVPGPTEAIKNMVELFIKPE